MKIEFFSLLLFLLFSILIEHSFQQCNTQGNGTTANIGEIFMGRCYYFLNILQSSNCNINPANYNCTTIFASFKTALVGKAPCSVSTSDFDNFLSLVNHPIPADTSLFWSGTSTTSHERM